MDDVSALGALVRGAVALVVFLAVFTAARIRFDPRRTQREPADIGLD